MTVPVPWTIVVLWVSLSDIKERWETLCASLKRGLACLNVLRLRSLPPVWLDHQGLVKTGRSGQLKVDDGLDFRKQVFRSRVIRQHRWIYSRRYLLRFAMRRYVCPRFIAMPVLRFDAGNEAVFPVTMTVGWRFQCSP